MGSPSAGAGVMRACLGWITGAQARILRTAPNLERRASPSCLYLICPITATIREGPDFINLSCDGAKRRAGAMTVLFVLFCSLVFYQSSHRYRKAPRHGSHNHGYHHLRGLS